MLNRFFPPRDEDGKYGTMTRGRNGPFVLYKEHVEKIEELRARIEALEKKDIKHDCL